MMPSVAANGTFAYWRLFKRPVLSLYRQAGGRGWLHGNTELNLGQL